MSGLILYIDGMNVNFKIFVLNVLVILQLFSFFIGFFYNYQVNYILNIMIFGVMEIVYIMGKKMYIFFFVKYVIYIMFGRGLILLFYFIFKNMMFQN